MDERFGLEVLVVDDSGTQRFHTQVVLSERGCNVRTAGDSRQALDMLKSFKPDLIVLDFFLPGIDGFGFLRLLQDDDRFSEIPIVVVTGGLRDPIMRSSIEKEPNVARILTKPPELSEFLEVIRKISKSKGRYQQVPAEPTESDAA